MSKFTIYNLQFTRKLLWLAVFFIFVFLTPTAFAADGSLSLSPASGTFNKGCTFSLDIIVNTGGSQTDGTDAILKYDPTRFTATAIRSGTIYADYPGNSIDAQNGKITISGLSSVSSTFTGTGTLASIDFIVPDTAPVGMVTQINFDFDPADKTKTTDSNVVERSTISDILTQVTDGNYTIGTGKCGGKGGPDSSKSATITKTPPPLPENEQLPTSGAGETTLILAIIGGTLTLLGILGLVIL